MLIILISLILGQSLALNAIFDHHSSNFITSPDFINADSNFSVDIYYVGTDPTSDREIFAQPDGSFHIIDPLAGDLNLVRLKTNITGWTCWGDCIDTNSTLDGIQTSATANITVGQMFVLVDGQISQVGAGYAGERGADIAVSLGTHVVTYLYMGKDDNKITYWASDTVIIRVANSANEVEQPLEYVTSSISINIKELATTSTIITFNPFCDINDPWVHCYIEYQFVPTSNLTISLNGEEIAISDSFEMDSSTKFAISGTVNSTGFDGFQIEESHNSTIGHTFLIDAAGIHDIANSPTHVTFFNTPFGSSAAKTIDFVETFIGVLTIGEYGRWHSGSDGRADHDGMSSTADGVQDFDASFDYTTTIEGVTILDFEKHSAITSSITSTETLIGSTSEILTTTTLVASANFYLISGLGSIFILVVVKLAKKNRP